ncbi:integrase, partial [Paraburkholderia sp. Se-20369]|nr:integrase [Paraburkholderia sp. Se-20369]
MNPPPRLPSQPESAPADFPDADELAALRAWYAGMTVRHAVERYLPDRLGDGRSARGVLGGIRRRLVRAARLAHRPDLAQVLAHPDGERLQEAKAVGEAIEILRHARAPAPHIGDDIDRWLPARAVATLRAFGIATLADLTVRIP